MKEIHQLLSSFTSGDAISNWALFLQRFLKDHGFYSEIFSESISPELVGSCRLLGDYPAVDSPEKILMAHYSIASMGMITLPKFKAKKILFYHNVTPWQYWENIHPLAAFHCLRGKTDLPEILPSISHGIAFSHFSLQDLQALGLKHTSFVPLRLDVSRLQRPPDPIMMSLYPPREKYVLVVGRIAPNKRIEEAIRIVKLLSRVRLLIAGTTRDSGVYYYALRDAAVRAQIKCDFLGHVSQEELNALYRLADVLLVVSDHEGFCVPILEAFYHQLPVVGYAAGAVPETANGGALLFDSRDPEVGAALVSRVLYDSQLREHLKIRGSEALKQHLEFPLEETLLKIIHEVSSAS